MAQAASLQHAPPPRLASLDILRGLVMLLMALDHVRDFFFSAAHEPTELAHTTPALFVTRWVTHFCAPVFVFLAGTGAFLSTERGKTRGELCRFLVTRGLWLVVLELTLVRLGWYFNFDYRTIEVQVIWALGWSMIALAGLLFFRTGTIALIGALIVGAHNLLDGAQEPSSVDWLWSLLHTGANVQVTAAVKISPLYPVLPWIGVMALGYGLAPYLLVEVNRRSKTLLWTGALLSLLFVVLRAVNVYGDPFPWSAQSAGLFTVFSFVNCHKYPPSLLYLLMTLGPAIALVGWMERRSRAGLVARILLTYGRVPLFYYLVHLPLIHLLAVIFARLRLGDAGLFFTNDWYPLPARFGYSLGVTYAVWAAVVLMLYPVCRFFGEMKAKHRSVWLSYL